MGTNENGTNILQIFYTGVKNISSHYTKQTQLTAWTNKPWTDLSLLNTHDFQKQVILSKNIREWRDPYVWKYKGV